MRYTVAKAIERSARTEERVETEKAKHIGIRREEHVMKDCKSKQDPFSNIG